MEKFRSEGMYKYNLSLLQANDASKEFLCQRRQKLKVTIDELLPCPQCKAFFSRHQLAAHIKKRHGYLPERNIQQKVAASLPCCETKVSDRFQEKILDTFQMGPIRNMVRNDRLIIARGMNIFKGKNLEEHPKALDHVREKMRELGRLVQEAQKLEPKIHKLEDLVDADWYDLIV